MNVKWFVFWMHVMLINVTKFVKTVDLQNWQNFKIEFKKQYATLEEENRRMEIFKDNLRKINLHNKKYKKGKVLTEMGMNKFGDMTGEEFEEITCSNITFNGNLVETSGSRRGGAVITSLPPGIGTAPKFKNWTADGAVTPVRNQDRPTNCGSCWAFAVVGAIESHNFIHTGKLVALSEQNLLDCVGQHHGVITANTCKGGRPHDAFQYVIDNQGIATAKSYPYTAKQGPCHYKDENKGATIVDYKQIKPRDEELLKSIVGLIGPVTANINAERQLQFHKNGVYISPKCKDSKVNHAVLIVGYGTEKNVPYWLVKNSWGTKKDHDGYFKIRRGMNECGISKENYYPVL